MTNAAPATTALALAVLLGAAPALPQEPSPDSSGDQVFVDTVRVEVVNIDVYVRDKDGHPVPGLTRDDFDLFIDGTPVAISNFYAVSSRAERPAPGSAPAATEAAAAAAEPHPSLAPVPADQKLHVVVYIDNYNLTQFNRNRVMRELRLFLQNELGREDRVMVVSYDRSIHMRHPFTSDRQQTTRALLELEEVSAQKLHRNRERQDLISAITDVDDGSLENALLRVHAYAGSIRNDMHFALDALSRIIENLAGSPGRKAVVYVSDGIPMIAAEDMFYFVSQLYESSMSLNEMTEYDLSKRFRELAAKANANRVSFYTIDARGLTVSSQATVDQAEAGFAGQQSFIDSVWMSNQQSPLQMMAEETGGRAIINANRVTPDLERVASDFNNYYSLGYAPGSAGDGRYHRIEVELRRPMRGVEVRHRSGYRDKSLESRMIDGTYSALNLDLQSNPLEARLVFGPPTPRDDGNFDTPIYLQIPFERLTLVERNDLYVGKLRLWFAAKDEEDHTTEPRELPVDIRIPSERIGETVGQSYTYRIPLVMEGGYHDIALGVLDELGAQDSFLRRGLDVRAR